MYGGQHKSEEEARAAAIALHNQHHPSGPQAAVHTDRQGASMPHLLPDNDCSALTAAAGQAEQLPAGSNQPRPQTTTVPRDTPAKVSCRIWLTCWHPLALRSDAAQLAGGQAAADSLSASDLSRASSLSNMRRGQESTGVQRQKGLQSASACVEL